MTIKAYNGPPLKEGPKPPEKEIPHLTDITVTVTVIARRPNGKPYYFHWHCPDVDHETWSVSYNDDFLRLFADKAVPESDNNV